MLSVYTCIVQEHDLLLVAVAVILCLLAAMATFMILEHARLGAARRGGWIALAAFVSGTGIWATHFVAMLSYRQELQVGFEPGATLLSIAAAILITGAGWSISLRQGWLSTPIGGAVVGAGIATMHYVGMSGVTLAGRIVWDEATAIVSVLIGIVLSAAAVANHRQHSSLIPWRAGLLFTLAICGLHFTGMSAVGIYPDPNLAVPAEAIDSGTLTAAVTAMALLIFVISFGVVTFDRAANIRQQQLVQQALDASESLNRGIIEASPDGVSLLDLDGNVLFVNQATLRECGVPDQASLVGNQWGSRFPAALRKRTDEAMARARNGEVSRVLLQIGGGDERWWDVMIAPVRDGGGVPIRLVVISRDLTDHKNAEDRARWSANHDPLTQLANRFLLQKRIDGAIERSARERQQFGLLLLDLDDFKGVNDRVGHDAGDALLCAFAEKLRAAVRPEDTVARLGGDEFAVVLTGAGSCEAIEAAVESIQLGLQEPCVYGGRMLECRASIGASLYPRDGKDRAELMKSSDIALYAAKSAGGGNLQIFRPEMCEAMRTRTSMLSSAKAALEQDYILPHYQPKIDLRCGTVAGFEALLRWNHPQKGIQHPDTLAAAFEDWNLAAAISDRMTDHVIRDVQRWRRDGIEFGHVAINAAAAEFQRGNFAERLLERMTGASIPTECVQVEITESVFLGRNAEYVDRALKTLNGAGVRIALDDFGTGYASLSHLKQYPVDFIKIDRSFVRELEEGSGDAAIVDAVVNLGRSLGISTIAEGVETVVQHRYLKSIGCDFGQGYYYERAMTAGQVPRIVEKYRAIAAGGSLAA